VSYEYVKRLPPEKRREINAKYYKRSKERDPQKHRARNERWRKRNRASVNESAKRYYYAHSVEIRFKVWLHKLLQRVARENERRHGRENCV
jgi:hypothetical protein